MYVGERNLYARRLTTRPVPCLGPSTQAAESLSEMIEFQAGTGGGSLRTEDRGGAGGSLQVVAGRDYGAREQFFILYGRYSNAKLLYRYCNQLVVHKP